MGTSKRCSAESAGEKASKRTHTLKRMVFIGPLSTFFGRGRIQNIHPLPSVCPNAQCPPSASGKSRRYFAHTLNPTIENEMNASVTTNSIHEGK